MWACVCWWLTHACSIVNLQTWTSLMNCFYILTRYTWYSDTPSNIILTLWINSDWCFHHPGSISIRYVAFFSPYWPLSQPAYWRWFANAGPLPPATTLHTWLWIDRSPWGTSVSRCGIPRGVPKVQLEIHRLKYPYSLGLSNLGSTPLIGINQPEYAWLMLNELYELWAPITAG